MQHRALLKVKGKTEPIVLGAIKILLLGEFIGGRLHWAFVKVSNNGWKLEMDLNQTTLSSGKVWLYIRMMWLWFISKLPFFPHM